ncbi:hypothetical protein NEUTE1DRAFT_108297 [Neurospora tetrasperma FGSC 2508]|uniref:Uncharacterized protein n=1 Tax=Neurospora tetrasperma (strain FGSC 2508 / ATCC MYA-4615 / P0657) TaxID=510951 RepID=F8MGX9_NEUT8|nr:uncharacterized protein NEUTE1DRAFT_108297 [Neurospora tetrasperma FGSC 2508]EGO58698.1 hypothetical protein NEUTE1DRAFT_108297 [Neurospora tetrasperma FGSC 2508]
MRFRIEDLQVMQFYTIGEREWRVGEALQVCRPYLVVRRGTHQTVETKEMMQCFITTHEWNAHLHLCNKNAMRLGVDAWRSWDSFTLEVDKLACKFNGKVSLLECYHFMTVMVKFVDGITITTIRCLMVLTSQRKDPARIERYCVSNFKSLCDGMVMRGFPTSKGFCLVHIAGCPVDMAKCPQSWDEEPLGYLPESSRVAAGAEVNANLDLLRQTKSPSSLRRHIHFKTGRIAIWDICTRLRGFPSEFASNSWQLNFVRRHTASIHPVATPIDPVVVVGDRVRL